MHNWRTAQELALFCLGFFCSNFYAKAYDWNCVLLTRDKSVLPCIVQSICRHLWVEIVVFNMIVLRVNVGNLRSSSRYLKGCCTRIWFFRNLKKTQRYATFPPMVILTPTFYTRCNLAVVSRDTDFPYIKVSTTPLAGHIVNVDGSQGFLF